MSGQIGEGTGGDGGAAMEANATVLAAAVSAASRDALCIVVPVTVVYVLIFVTGVAGNIVTVVVIARCRCMHTPTNYYLMSLATSDLVLLLSGLPQEVHAVWVRHAYPFGDAVCVLRGLAAEASANASVLTITAFTVERYLAICRPFVHASRTRSPSRTIACIWAVALGFATVQALQFGVRSVRVEGVTYQECQIVRVLLAHSFEAASVLFFVAPMTLMCVLYALIGQRLHRQRCQALGHNASSLRHVAAKKRVIKMLAGVVVAFFLCWAPFHAQRLLAIHGSAEAHAHLNDVLTYVSGVLHYVSATANPILYHSMSRKFRKAGKDTLASLLPGLKWSQQRRTRRPDPHGPRCGTGGGGLCRGPTVYRHRHAPHPPGLPATGDTSSSSSSDSEGESCNMAGRGDPDVSPRAGGGLGGARVRLTPSLSPDRPDIVAGTVRT